LPKASIRLVDKFSAGERFLDAYIEGDDYNKTRGLNKTISFDKHKRISSAYTFGNILSSQDYEIHRRRNTEVNYLE